LFNESLSTGDIPGDRKLETVTAVFKKVKKKSVYQTILVQKFLPFVKL